MNDQAVFEWQRYPEAWQWVNDQLDAFTRRNRDIDLLSQQLKEIAGARLVDFTDHLAVTGTGDIASQLEGFGYRLREDGRTWAHPGADLPYVVLKKDPEKAVGAAVAVDSIAHFLMVRGLDRPINGSLFSRFRSCEVSVVNGTGLWVVERRSSKVMEPVEEPEGYLPLYFKTLEKWLNRPRSSENPETAMEQVLALAEEQVADAGTDLAAYLFFEAERRYWQSRNRAAGIQKHLLDSVGVGWASHDHHTFRSSRAAFSQLVRFFQVLGFHLREKFYAGEEAGWGAQVVENPVIDIALFLDVDLSPGEIDIDFRQQGLAPAENLGTVGLWCALHGDSLMEAGLHHLAVQADFNRLTQNLKMENVKMMTPFSTMPHLQQAFTFGEAWPVSEARVQKLSSVKAISGKAAGNFLKEGAVGSHMENIQRADGYKGFSQKEVSSIIKETDPQHYKF